MKNLNQIILAILMTGSFELSKAQTTAMDFTMNDCDGNMHQLYSDLDSNYCVIIEFFMQSCASCVTAGTKLEQMKSTLLSEFPGKIKSYAIGFNNSYTCTSIKNWVTNNSFTSIPMDSGATQVAYYGGMGMPTIVILGGGSTHAILGSPYIGFSTSDTTTMASDIRNFLSNAASSEPQRSIQDFFSAHPNPADNSTTLSMNISVPGELFIELVDITGKTVESFSDFQQKEGIYTRKINTGNLTEGTYFVRVNQNGKTSAHKLQIVR